MCDHLHHMWGAVCRCSPRFVDTHPSLKEPIGSVTRMARDLMLRFVALRRPANLSQYPERLTRWQEEGVHAMRSHVARARCSIRHHDSKSEGSRGAQCTGASPIWVSIRLFWKSQQAILAHRVDNSGSIRNRSTISKSARVESMPRT